MFKINRKSDYALLLVSHLVGRQEYISLSRLVETTNLPPRFIARIASDLVKHGILKSKEGKIGGYRLVKNLSSISLLEFLKIFEHDLRLTKCQSSGYECGFVQMCKHGKFLKNHLSSILYTQLNNLTLDEVIKK